VQDVLVRVYAEQATIKAVNQLPAPLQGALDAVDHLVAVAAVLEHVVPGGLAAIIGRALQAHLEKAFDEAQVRIIQYALDIREGHLDVGAGEGTAHDSNVKAGAAIRCQACQTGSRHRSINHKKVVAPTGLNGYVGLVGKRDRR